MERRPIDWSNAGQGTEALWQTAPPISVSIPCIRRACSRLHAVESSRSHLSKNQKTQRADRSTVSLIASSNPSRRCSLGRHRQAVGCLLRLAHNPGRIQTCNQTVMSGRLSISFVDFAPFSSAVDCVCCVSVRSFLVRNWCGCKFAVRTVGDRRRALLFDSSERRRFDSGRTYREPAGILLACIAVTCPWPTIA
jgi:hypothetical protein